MAIELERVRSEADERRRAELDQLRAEADAAREQAVAAAREKAQLQADEALATELQRVRAEAERTLSTEADKARAAAEHAKTAEAARIESEQELARVRREAEERLSMLIDGLGFDMGGGVTEPIASAPPADAPPRPSVPAAAEAVTPVGRLEVHSIPARARVAVDGEMRGLTPLVLDDVAPGRHEVVVSSSAGTVRRTATVRENRTVTIYETISPGWIAVFSRIKLDIAIDGRQVGTTEDGHLLVPPGRHDVVLANRRLGFRERHTFDVEPGEVTAHTVVLPSTSVRFTGIAGTEILVDGEPIGVLPLASVELPIGTREFVKRFPDGTEARERIELGIGAPTTIAVDARAAPPAAERRGTLTVFPPGHR